MAVNWQLVVDCTEPISLARFWAAALEYQPEDNSALIEGLITAGAVGEDDYTEVDGRRAWVRAAAIRHPEDPVDAPTGIGLGRRVLFQTVPEPKSTKNRLHIDLGVGAEQRDGAVRRLEGLGASVVRVVEEHGASHVTMRDPEGNEFDVQ